MVTLFTLFGLFGLFMIGVLLVVIAQLSRRLGQVTHARPYYFGLYISAVLVWLGFLIRLVIVLDGIALFPNVNQNNLYMILSDIFPALGLTIGLAITWYYWSWLLAERD